MEQNKEKIRHILQYYYDKGKNAPHAATKICAVYGPDTVSISTAQRWFQRFRSGAEVIEDAARSGRPVVENCDKIAELIERAMQKRPSLINRGRIVFHQDNARPHTSLVTRQKLRELGLEVLLHPPYSPALAPSDYHLFLSMANELGSRNLATRESCENWLTEFFDNSEASFYKRGIMKVASRWELVIAQNGACLT